MRITIFVIIGFFVYLFCFVKSAYWFDFYEEFLEFFGVGIRRNVKRLIDLNNIVGIAFAFPFIASAIFLFNQLRNQIYCVLFGLIALNLFPFFAMLPYFHLFTWNAQAWTEIIHIDEFKFEYFALVGSIFGTFISAYFLKRTERKRFPDKSNDELLDVD